MADFDINRINELYKKSQTVGLTEEEKAEQHAQRQAYIKAFHNNLRGTLDNIKIQNPDGSVEPLKKDQDK